MPGGRCLVAVHTRRPAILAALEAGRITLAKARIINAETMNLPDDRAAAVERQVLAKARQQTPEQLRAATSRAVLSTGPAAAQRRAEQARRERGVRMWPEPDGMAPCRPTCRQPMPSACSPSWTTPRLRTHPRRGSPRPRRRGNLAAHPHRPINRPAAGLRHHPLPATSTPRRAGDHPRSDLPVPRLPGPSSPLRHRPRHPPRSRKRHWLD